MKFTKLTPATQAVWDAFNDVSERVGVFEDYGDALAAALRAAAKPVHWTWNAEMFHKHLVTIAQELEEQ